MVADRGDFVRLVLDPYSRLEPTIASRPLMVVKGWEGLIVVMSSAYLIWDAL